MKETIDRPPHAPRGRGKSGGFPCRFGSCDERFFVAQAGSVESLLTASRARTDHEIATHDYHHKSWEVAPARPFGAGPAPRPKAPRSRAEIR